MVVEYNALLGANTWELVKANSNMNIIGCKWVFKLKKISDGTIDKYKARLVAKGYNQREWLDYEETFSPMVKHVTIRIVLSLSIKNKWVMNN